jgi:hypothetical protein
MPAVRKTVGVRDGDVERKKGQGSNRNRHSHDHGRGSLRAGAALSASHGFNPAQKRALVVGSTASKCARLGRMGAGVAADRVTCPF